MFWNTEPLIATLEDALPQVEAEQWLQAFHLHIHLGPMHPMIDHLCVYLSVEEVQLWDRVQEQLNHKTQGNIKMCEDWFLKTNQTREDYEAKISHLTYPVNGLFIVLAAQWVKVHVAIAHK